MGILYADTGGNAANSGSTDNTSPLTGTTATATASTTVTLDAGTVLTSVVTSGPTQSTINLAGTSNGNRTIYWITGTAGSGGATPTVTIDAAVTCAGVAWRIGGQYLWPSGAGVNVMEGALGLGLAQDILQFNNSPATKTVVYLTARQVGDSTKGQVIIRGKAGTRPVLNITNTVACLTLGQQFWHIENLELQQNGASGNAITTSNGAIGVFNVKISDAGAAGLAASAGGSRCSLCEVSGVGTSGLTSSSQDFLYFGNYIHDNAGDAVLVSSTSVRGNILFNILDTNAGRGVFLSGATTSAVISPVTIYSNTIYGNGDSGIEATDQDTLMVTTNNILKDNGNAGTEYNYEQVAGMAEFISSHRYNCFNIGGGAGGGNVLNLTLDATEITTDPLFVDAANGDFRLNTGSPCLATGFPGQFLGGPLGYLDMGAVQRIAATTHTSGF